MADRYSEEQGSQWISFVVGHEQYALPVSEAREVLPYTPTSPVPGVSDEIEGILSFRDKLVPILAGRKVLAESGDAAEEHTQILLVDTPLGQFGLTIDRIGDLVTLPATDIERRVSQTGSDHVVGTAKFEDGLIILLDLSRYLEKFPELG